MIEIMDPGSQTLIQDRGRHGHAGVGVTPSGAFDRGAAALANRLVGNDADAAVFEIVGGGFRLATDERLLIAVTGARGPVVCDARAQARDTGIHVPAGASVSLGAPTAGLRSYLAIRGGLATPAVLGSRSRDTLGGLGPAPLVAGDLVEVGPARLPPPGVAHAPTPGVTAAQLRVLPGPRLDWFEPSAWSVLTSARWQVSADSNRVGLRLVGPQLRRAPATEGRELPPEPLVRGAIQVPPDGQPIVLGPDHPTTGGYPVIGVVDAAGSDRCGQAVPGETVLFSSAGR